MTNTQTEATTAQIDFIRSLQADKAYQRTAAHDPQLLRDALQANVMGRLVDARTRGTDDPALQALIDAKAAQRAHRREHGYDESDESRRLSADAAAAETAYVDHLYALNRTRHEQALAALDTDPSGLSKAEASDVIDLLKSL